MSTTKVCRRCSVRKPVTQFYKHRESRDGHLGTCIRCILDGLDRKRRAEGRPIRTRNSHRRVA